MIMNANELADWLNDPLGYKMGEIAIMLRHLQSENDLLKAQVKRLKEIIEKSIDMNNALGKM
jgi:hypothetical protein